MSIHAYALIYDSIYDRSKLPTPFDAINLRGLNETFTALNYELKFSFSSESCPWFPHPLRDKVKRIKFSSVARYFSLSLSFSTLKLYITRKWICFFFPIFLFTFLLRSSLFSFFLSLFLFLFFLFFYLQRGTNFSGFSPWISFKTVNTANANIFYHFGRFFKSLPALGWIFGVALAAPFLWKLSFTIAHNSSFLANGVLL